MLGVDGYFYYLERITKQRTYNWSCSKRIACHCKSRLVTELKDGIHCVIKRSGVHTHSPEAVEGFVRDANIKLKELSKQTCLPASQIIRETIVLTPSESRDALPSKMAQKSKIMRTRKKKWNMKEPKTVDDIDMPLNLYVLEGELFVLAEKWVDDEFFIILGTKSSLEMLSSSDCWAVDGTFHVVPRVMRQLFSIHGRVHGEIVPLVFCLMSKKTLKSYVAVFNELLTIAGNHELNLCPRRIICDFEMGIISAIKQCFPNTDLRGCLFHFGQIIWRKVQKER